MFINTYYFCAMMRRLIAALICCCCVVSVQAQTKKHLLKPYFQLDTYHSFIGNKSADVWGFKAGVEWNGEWRFALGYNNIQSDIIEYKKLPESERKYADSSAVKAQLYMQYFPVMAEYVFYHKDPWALSVPVCLGYGKSYFEYFTKEEDRRRIFSHGVLVNDIGMNAQYKILSFIGLGVGIGYRFMLVNNPEIDTRFNTPIFSFRIKVFPGELYRILTTKESESPE